MSGTAFDALPLSFEPNRGQADPTVGFLARGRGYTVALTATGASFTLPGRPTKGASAASRPDILVSMALAGGNPAARGQGLGALPGTVGYLSEGRALPKLADIPTYAEVRYTDVYPGVDLIYYGHQQHLEYDFRVAPGADPGRIRLAFRGGARPVIAANGDLILRTVNGVLRQHRPNIYQTVHGARHAIQGGYALEGKSVGFHLGAYDRRAALVIDPVLVYSTYYGGAGDDFGNGIAVDGHGNVYLVGTSNSGSKTSLAFVSKFDPTGKHVLYTKFISNIYASSPRAACNSTGTGIAVDGNGNAIITGMYGDVDQFNLCNNQAVLWAKIDPSGKAAVNVFGSYGGSKGNAIAVDRGGDTYITGATDQWEKNFPVTQGAFQTKPGIDKQAEGLAGDAFVLKVDPSGQVVYGTFLGGSYIDEGLGITVDGQGNAYVVGTAGSSNFPITANAIQTRMGNPYAAGFLSILSADGSALLYSTFLTGDNGEDAHGVALDRQGYVYVVGSTDSRNFPTTPNAYDRTCGDDAMCSPIKTWYTDYGTNTNYWRIAVSEDVFVAKIDPRRSGAAALLYCTFLGGLNRDLGTAIAVDRDGRAYVTGRTASADFPGAQKGNGSSFDAILAVIDPRQSGAASLVFSAGFGGSGYDEGDGIALDKAGNVYVTGYTGSAKSFPTYKALQPSSAGRYDAFVTKIGGFASRS